VIIGLLWLLGSLLVGEILVRIFDAPVPGSIVGMVLLFVALRWRRASDGSSVVRVGHYLLDHLQLFFVPAGVGIVVYLSTVRAYALPIAAGLLVSWLLGLVTVAVVVTALSWRRADPGGAPPESIE
jgi:putative effector of murein hydrolase LrgA (UPF0299 family)